MLRIDTPEIEFFDEATNTFETIKPQHLQLEHSLLSASKWEARWRIPFLDGKERTRDQMIDYIYCMTINHNVDKRVYDVLPQEILDKISDYIETPQTATTFSSDRASGKGHGYGGHHQRREDSFRPQQDTVFLREMASVQTVDFDSRMRH